MSKIKVCILNHFVYLKLNLNCVIEKDFQNGYFSCYVIGEKYYE